MNKYLHLGFMELTMTILGFLILHPMRRLIDSLITIIESLSFFGHGVIA